MHRTRYLVGLLTLVLAGIGTAFLLRLLRADAQRDGLQLAVEFADARGLRAGADVRYRGVTVGTVRKVTIALDGGRAVADVLLDPQGAAQACVDSEFWIVTPRFSGIATGASGLDTLVRDAYVAFLTPADRGSALLGGSLIAGRERPPQGMEQESLEPVEHGDLLMHVLVPENHGLRAGSAVVFRGTQTGDVRDIRLVEDGSHVEVMLRIARRYRQTVTDRAEFWIARPHLSGALFSGFSITDVSALLTPYVSYYADSGEGVPVEDGWRTAALASRPDVTIADVPSGALARTARPPKQTSDALVLVHVVYAAVEEDALSADDPIRREGTGVLYLDGSGRAAVATARSLVDGSYTETDLFGGDPDVAQEQIKVMTAGGQVLRAGRVWVDPDGRDLAVLVVDGAPPDLATTPAARFAFMSNGEAPELAAVREGKGVLRATGADGRELESKPADTAHVPLAERWGAAVLAGDTVIGVYGRSERYGDVPAVVSLGFLPADLRPAQAK